MRSKEKEKIRKKREGETLCFHDNSNTMVITSRHK